MREAWHLLTFCRWIHGAGDERNDERRVVVELLRRRSRTKRRRRRGGARRRRRVGCFIGGAAHYHLKKRRVRIHKQRAPHRYFARWRQRRVGDRCRSGECKREKAKNGDCKSLHIDRSRSEASGGGHVRVTSKRRQRRE